MSSAKKRDYKMLFELRVKLIQESGFDDRASLYTCTYRYPNVFFWLEEIKNY